jgi:hypothetical protein
MTSAYLSVSLLGYTDDWEKRTACSFKEKQAKRIIYTEDKDTGIGRNVKNCLPFYTVKFPGDRLYHHS